MRPPRKVGYKRNFQESGRSTAVKGVEQKVDKPESEQMREG